MAVDKKAIEDFDTMFDLPSEKKDDDNEQSEEYGHSTGSDDPFSSLAEEVSDAIKDNDSKGHDLSPEDPHDIVKEVCSEDIAASTPVEEKVEEVEVKEEVVWEVDDMFDSSTPEKPEEKEESPEDPVDDDIFDDIDIEAPPEESAKTSESSSDYGEVGDGSDSIEWMLESPTSMYNSFYAKKRDLLFKYMVGGQIEYKRWTRELDEAQVTIRGEVFDHQLIIDQMEAVQQHRERVKSIHVRVNNQYFTFKRFIDLMKGFLARIEYLKPVVKQDGLIMEHMRDIELYYARLEALHDSSTKTEKMLAAAFDTLSRKLTICMELRPSERVDPNIVSRSYKAPEYVAPSEEVRKQSSDFDKFDDLPNNAQAAPSDHKMGSIGWGDI